LWAGNWLGAWLMGPITVRPLPEMPNKPAYLVELGPFKIRLENPGITAPPPTPGSETVDRLAVRPSAFGPALLVVGGLLFGVSGSTMWLSAAGRFRWRVLGLAILIALVHFLVNLIGQMWDGMEFLRPLTVFYYYQPQQVILGHHWTVGLSEWNGGHSLFPIPMLLVLYGVGLFGYAMALWTFSRRDLPGPL
jgi:ABC-2 type transport system permease protein